MDRRKFLKNIGLLGAGASIMLNGIPVKALKHAGLFQSALQNSNSDKILVLLQMHGGNDGLNTLVPISNYQNYYDIRANVALPLSGRRSVLTLDKNLPDEQQIALHPELAGIKQLYDEGSAAFVQNVGYENTNMSHFRARDIFFMGGDYNQKFASGWMGRYLNELHPDYPDGYPSSNNPDPLAMELGNAFSLAFHRNNGIPMGLSLASPEAFYELISNVGITPPSNFPDSYYGDELQYLMQMEDKAGDYAERLKVLYDAGQNHSSVLYPEKYPLAAPAQYQRNPLSEQLKILARLISGGCGIRIYIVRIGGFDTHAEQVEAYDNTMGRHSALLYHVSSAVKAFYDDLKAQGLDERVLTMTFSEFGRRGYSNAGYGTDHGKAAPVMLFGPALAGGVYGNNPDLTDLDRGNLKYRLDYRQVYTAVLKDWLGASDSAVEAAYFDNYVDNRIELFGEPEKTNKRNTDIHRLYSAFPNPAKNYVTMSFYLASPEVVSFSIRTLKGQNLQTENIGLQKAGNHKYRIDLSGLKPGYYVYSFSAGKIKRSDAFSKK